MLNAIAVICLAVCDGFDFQFVGVAGGLQGGDQRLNDTDAVA
jgi:hypothetical protein